MGPIELTKLTPSDIQALEAKLTTSGMAPMGVREVHHVISGALKYALKMDAVWRNPALAVTPPKAERKEVVPPNMAGVKQILAMAQANEHRFFSCLHFIAYTGVRRGEALGLRWRNVDLETGAASIAQTVVVSQKQGLIFQPPKTNSGRRGIDLDDDTVAVLRALQGQQLLHKAALEGAYQDRNLVFANALGNPVYPDTLTRHFRKLAGAVGLEGLKLHDLRHFHASVLIQRGESPVLVSKRLGHATVSITMDVYAHLLKGYQKDAANGFAKAMREA